MWLCVCTETQFPETDVTTDVKRASWYTLLEFLGFLKN